MTAENFNEFGQQTLLFLTIETDQMKIRKKKSLLIHFTIKYQYFFLDCFSEAMEIHF